MAREIDAHCVSIEEDSDRWLVAFADAEFNARHYLLLQRDKSPDAQDVEFGLDGYHVEVDREGNSGYGGIKRFELFPDHALVEFEDDADFLPDGESIVVIGLTLRRQQLAQLRNCLARIFRGDDCYLDRSD